MLGTGRGAVIEDSKRMVVATRTSKSGARSEEMPSIHACALLTSAECPTLAMEECSKGLEFSFDTWICVVNISI